MSDLLRSFTSFLGYLGDEIVIMEEGLDEANISQVRKSQLNSKQIHLLLPKILKILNNEPLSTSTTQRPIPPDIMKKINELKELYSSSTAEEQQELRDYIQGMIDEGPEPMHGGKRRMTRKKKSKSKKSKKSKSKKSRNSPSYRSILKLISS